MALGNSRLATGVQGEGVAVNHALQVGADVLRVHRRLRYRRHGVGVHWLQQHQRLALRHIGTGHGADFQHLPGGLGCDQMLHLHGFQHGNLLACRDQRAHRDIQLHDLGRHGRAHGGLLIARIDII